MRPMIKCKNQDAFIFSNVFGVPFLLIGILIIFKLPEVLIYGLFFAIIGGLLVGFRIENELNEEGLLRSKKIYFITFSSKQYLYSEFESIKVDIVSNIGRKGLNRRTRKTIDVEMTYKSKPNFISGVDLTTFFKIKELSVTNNNVQLWKRKIADFSNVSGLMVVYTETYNAEVATLFKG